MDFIDMLSIILPALAFISVFIILVINIYAKLRPSKYITVNCWFCNQWTKVLRELENAWDCPFCEQYNGFTKDGDYNKPIPEQHDEFMNKVFPESANRKSVEPTNGLCNACNNNQQLKVQQLAMFSPLDENNYDEEVERYEKQLERAYRLCPQCETTVNCTLQKQKSILLGFRLSTIKKQGINLLDLNQSSSGISVTAKRRFFLTAINYTTIALAIIHIFETLKICDFSHKNIRTALPGTVVPYFLLFRDIIFLLFNCISSLYESLQSIQEIFLQYSISLIEYYLQIQVSEIVSYNNFNLDIFKNYNSVILLFVGLFLQTVFLMFSDSKPFLELTKCAAWFSLLFSNLGLLQFSFIREDLLLQVVEIGLCCLITFCPSSTYKIIKMNTNTIRNKFEFPDKEIDCDNIELLNSTFKSQISEKLNTSTDSNKANNPFEISPNSTMKLFNLSSNTNESTHVFGKQPVFVNSFNSPFYNFTQNYRSCGSSIESLSTKKSCNNDSLNSSNSSDKVNESLASLSTKELSPNKSLEQDWFKGLTDLHLSTTPKIKKVNNDELPAAFRVSSSLQARPKPVLSPPRLQNVTQSSWVAGGYWKSNEYLNNAQNFTNLSRSSSLSSGFGSQASSQQQPNTFDHTIFNSLPCSRTTSMCGDYDRFSVLSEPAYYNNFCSQNNRFYPTLKPDQQIYICPKPMHGTNQSRLSKSPTNTVLNDNLWNANHTFAYPMYNSQRPASRESNYTQNVLNSSVSSYTPFPNSSFNPFYSHSNIFPVQNIRPLTNNSTYSQPYEKGSLLKKWREQHSTGIH